MKALSKVYPETKGQRFWVHKTANVLNKVSKAVQPKMKEAMQKIWMTESREQAYTAFDNTVKRFEAKYQKSNDLLGKRQSSNARLL